LRLLTPWAALLALTALAPLAVFVLRERRARRVRGVLGLQEPSLRSRAPLAVALAAAPALLGLAAAQPVVDESRTRPERLDAEAYVVVDISRSMLASADPEAPTRFQRARDAAIQIRSAVPEVPVGIASITDRVLPHSLPTTDARVFANTLRRSVGIERPGPTLSYSNLKATTYDALASIATGKYFAPQSRKRVLVVLTDGETRPLAGELARTFTAEKPPIQTIFVHFWSPDERIYETGIAEAGYQAERGAAVGLQSVAGLVDGQFFPESALAEVQAAVREAVGAGPTKDQRLEGERLALMPWVTLAAFVPLAFVLYRRNL
jgi:hypothetical protein